MVDYSARLLYTRLLPIPYEFFLNTFNVYSSNAMQIFNNAINLIMSSLWFKSATLFALFRVEKYKLNYYLTKLLLNRKYLLLPVLSSFGWHKGIIPYYPIGTGYKHVKIK